MWNRLAFALLAVASGTLHAQSPIPGPWIPPDSTTYAQLARRVGHKDRVRIWWRDGPVEVAGRAVGAGGVHAPWNDSMLAWSAIARVQVRGSAYLKGVKIGTIIGGVSGALAGMASLRACQGWVDMFCGADAGDVVAMTLGGALVYGFLGGLIAAPFGTWRTVYRARPAPAVENARVVAAVSPDPRGRPTLLLGVRLRR